jgi:hypothetical protein
MDIDETFRACDDLPVPDAATIVLERNPADCDQAWAIGQFAGLRWDEVPEMPLGSADFPIGELAPAARAYYTMSYLNALCREPSRPIWCLHHVIGDFKEDVNHVTSETRQVLLECVLATSLAVQAYLDGGAPGVEPDVIGKLQATTLELKGILDDQGFHRT